MPHVSEGVELEVTSIMARRRREREAEAQAFPGIRGTQSILPEADLIPADREQLRKNRFGAFHARTLRARSTELRPLSDTDLRRREGPAVALSDDDLNRELMERARNRMLAGQQAQARRVEGDQSQAEARRPEAERQLFEVRNIGETDQQYADRLNSAGFPPDMIEQALKNIPFVAPRERRTPDEVKARATARKKRISDASQAIRDRRERRRRAGEPPKRQGPPPEFPGSLPRRARGAVIDEENNLAFIDSIADTLTQEFADVLRSMAATTPLDRLSILAKRHEPEEDARLSPEQRNAKAELVFQLEANEGEAKDLRRERSEPYLSTSKRDNIQLRLDELRASRSELRRKLSAIKPEPVEAEVPSPQEAPSRPSSAIQSPTGGSGQLAPGLTFQQEQQRQRNYEALKPAQPDATISLETLQALLDHVRSFHPEAQTFEEQRELAISIALEMGWKAPQ